MSEDKQPTENLGSSVGSSRYEVADHPFDKGYFDAVEGRTKSGGRQYRQGWRTAKAELRSERIAAVNQVIAEQCQRKRDSAT